MKSFAGISDTVVTYCGRLRKIMGQPLRKKCPYSEFFCSVFSLILSEFGEIRSISPYSVQMRENMDQKNSEYGHFLRSEHFSNCSKKNTWPSDECNGPVIKF